MAKVSLDNESKTKVSLSTEGKNADLIWDDADWTWDDAGDSKWNAPKLSLTNESKTKVSLSTETK